MPVRPILLVVLVAAVVGCAKGVPEYTERKRIDEELRSAEIESFLRVAESLPKEPLEFLRRAYPPLPEWSPDRTLPVSELVRLERHDLDNGWDVEWLVRHHEPSRRLSRKLAAEDLTYEQFVALGLSIGASLSKSRLRSDQDLDEIRAKWLDFALELERDARPFTKVPPEARYRVLQEAGWQTRAHRAEKLANVPPQNVKRVARFKERLASYFPESLLGNPFDPIVDPLEDFGIPFRDPDPERSAGLLRWSSDEAIVGTDPPDSEFRGPSDETTSPVASGRPRPVR